MTLPFLFLESYLIYAQVLHLKYVYCFYFLDEQSLIQKVLTQTCILKGNASFLLEVSGLILRSLTHVGLIYVKGEKKISSFLLLHVDIQFSKKLLKTQSFLHMFGIFIKSSGIYTYVELYLVLESMCLLMCQYHACCATMALHYNSK